MENFLIFEEKFFVPSLTSISDDKYYIKYSVED